MYVQFGTINSNLKICFSAFLGYDDVHTFHFAFCSHNTQLLFPENTLTIYPSDKLPVFKIGTESLSVCLKYYLNGVYGYKPSGSTKEWKFLD